MKTIACFGNGRDSCCGLMYSAMDHVGRILALSSVRVITGGYGGSGMEAPIKGAKSCAGKVMGFVLNSSEPTPNVFLKPNEIEVCDGSSIEVSYGNRLGKLLSADGFIIGANGGAGTMVKLMAIINLNAKVWRFSKHIAILKPNGVSGLGEQTLFFLGKMKILDMAGAMCVSIVETPKEAVEWVVSYLEASG